MPDQTPDGTDSNRPPRSNDLLSRRSVLTATAGVLSVAALGKGAAASTSDYDVITVPSGTHKEFNVGDGETFENKLIDITADGATFRIDAGGKDWTIRNVGVRGEWDVISDGHEQGIIAEVDEGEIGVIDSFYFADGCPDDTYPGVTGIYVRRTHAGMLRINNVNIQDMPNNAIYASTMGRPDDNSHDVPGGEGGVLEITNSFAADCKAAHFRIGTTGSLVKNCVATGGGDRGVWAKFNDTRIVDSDLTSHYRSYTDGDVVCGSYGWEASAEATVTLENTVFGHSAPGDQDVKYAGSIIGDATDRAPRTTPPEGVPLSAEEAAASKESDTTTTTETHTFKVELDDGVDWRSYSLTTDGELTRKEADEYDKITQNDDGSWTASGAIVGGGTDSYQFTGDVLDWTSEMADSECTILLDGVEVSQSDLPSGSDSTDGSTDDSTDDSTNDSTTTTESHTLKVELDDGVDWRSYSLTTDGELTRKEADEYDKITQNDDGSWTASGAIVGGGTDSYQFTGDVLDWTSEMAASECDIFVDGQLVTMSEL